MLVCVTVEWGEKKKIDREKFIITHLVNDSRQSISDWKVNVRRQNVMV